MEVHEVDAAQASAELRPNTRGRAELCSVAWAAACLAHESERHLDAAVDTVAAAHGALAADADDDGARDAGSPTLGDAPTPPGAPMARTRRLRALQWLFSSRLPTTMSVTSKSSASPS